MISFLWFMVGLFVGIVVTIFADSYGLLDQPIIPDEDE